MRADARRVSAASVVFFAVAAAVAILVVVLAVLLVVDAQRSARVEAEEVTRGVATSIAVTPSVAAALGDEEPSAILQPLARGIMTSAGADFVTIMTPDGVRVAHRPDRGPHRRGASRNPANIGVTSQVHRRRVRP